MTPKEKRPALGIFGGSFHPPHAGHVEAARRFLDCADLDFLFVIPAFLPPHKTLSAGADAEDRFEMAKIAFQPLGSRVRVLRTEIESAHACYTVDTLKFFAREFSQYDLYLYTGSDMFLTLESWHDFRRLFSLATVAVLARENDEDAVKKHARYLAETYGARTLLMGSCTPVSSTQIREKLFSGVRPSAVDRHVLEYIENHGLYRREERQA